MGEIQGSIEGVKRAFCALKGVKEEVREVEKVMNCVGC